MKHCRNCGQKTGWQYKLHSDKECIANLRTINAALREMLKVAEECVNFHAKYFNDWAATQSQQRIAVLRNERGI